VSTGGTAVAVWQNEGQVLTNGAGLDEAFAAAEIAAGSFDGAGIWACTNLTDNGYLDHSPQLAMGTNGLGLLTWVSNPSNNPLGSITSVNSIAYSLWDGVNWAVPGVVVTNLRMLLWSDLAYDGSEGVWLGAIDEDDNQETITNQEIYASVYNGSSWGELMRLTTNNVQDTRPQAVYDAAGGLLVTWYRDGHLMADNDLVLGDATAVGAVGESSSAKAFDLVTGPEGQVSMVWEDYASDGTGPDPFMLNYDATLQSWSQPLQLLSDDILERSLSSAYTSTGSLLVAYAQVDIPVDTNGYPEFENETADLCCFEHTIGGDLAVFADDLTFSTNVVCGQTVDVYAVVRNLGELAATNVNVAFYDGNPGAGGVLIGSTQTLSGVLAAGTSAVAQVSWTVPESSSNRTVYAVVDPAQVLMDRNRANNTAYMSVLAPDLEISEMSYARTTAGKRAINARACNIGTLPSDQSAGVVFHRGSPTGTILQTIQISALATGALYDANFEWDMSGYSFTEAYELVYAFVDETNDVSEADETNNTRMVSVITTLDTDGDGLLDGDEQLWGTSTNSPDTDGDGLSDGDEVHIHATDPTLADTDGDGFLDGSEYRADTDPHSTNSFLAITSIISEGGGLRVYWQGGEQATQWLEGGCTLGAEGEQWDTIFTNVPPTSLATNILDIDVTTCR